MSKLLCQQDGIKAWFIYKAFYPFKLNVWMSKGMQDYLLWAVECDGNSQDWRKQKKASEKVKV